MRVIGYCRVSTKDQAERGRSLDAQRSKIVARYPDAEIGEPEARSGGKMANRPALLATLAGLGRGDRLVVASLSRVARNSSDLDAILTRAKRDGWVFESLDIGLDTGSMMGGFMATVVGAMAQLERQQNSVRVCDALEERRPELADRREAIADLRDQGLSHRAIAGRLGLHKEQVSRSLRRVR
jgi:site-specific DNA recombinase